MPKVRKDAIVWVEPDLVLEVEFVEWTHDGRLRAPSYQGLREDKEAEDVQREESRAGDERDPQGQAGAQPGPISAPTGRTSSPVGITVTIGRARARAGSPGPGGGADLDRPQPVALGSSSVALTSSPIERTCW